MYILLLIFYFIIFYKLNKKRLMIMYYSIKIIIEMIEQNKNKNELMLETFLYAEEPFFKYPVSAASDDEFMLSKF